MSRLGPAGRAVLSASLGLGTILTACAPPGATASGPQVPSTETGAGSASSSALPPMVFAPLAAEPAKRSNAELALAFDAEGAARLLAQPPSAIDFSRQALVCLYLGERTGPWTVTLLSAALSPGSLTVRARETRPRSGAPGSDQMSYPGTCATIDRASLPVGSLAARAEDTTSGEFIVAATINVPPR
jgi:hypothetical protein